MKLKIHLAALSLLTVLAAISFTGCAFNAKEQVPGVSWKHAQVDVDTNGVTHAVIDNYDSKKDVALTVNPATHVVTLGSVMNPANTAAAGLANQVTITAYGDAATKLTGAIGGAVGAGAAGAAQVMATGK